MKKDIPLSYIELSRKNLEHNLTSLRSIAKKGTKFAVAIKGNAYGHGQNEIALMSEKFADYFIVNCLEELRLLRKVSKKPTFVLGYIAPAYLAEAIKLKAILSVFSISQLEKINTAAKSLKKIQDVHISCDALLGREGFVESDLKKLFAKAKKLSNIKIAGMYGHFANIEDTNNFTHAQKQIDMYAHMREVAASCGFADLDTHLSATSGLLAYEKESGENTIVRVGIGMYGLWPSEHLEFFHNKNIPLRAVLTWKSHVAQVKTLPAGSTIGYGLTYMAKKEMKIALIPQGYADGFPRALSNKGEVLIGGVRCPVVGRVSMNMFTVDVSHLKRVREGETVILIGGQGKARISAEEVAARSDTINYEATTRISALLPRTVV